MIFIKKFICAKHVKSLKSYCKINIFSNPFAQVFACGCGVAALAPHINGAGQFVNRRSFLEKSSEIVRTKHRCPCVLLNIVVDQVSLKALRHKMVLRCLLHQI